MAATSLATNIEFIETLFFSCLTGGATILSSQYFGKKDLKTIEKIFGLILKYTFIISIIFTFLALVFPEFLMSLFTNEKELIEIGIQYIIMASGAYLLTGINQCYLCIMKTIGQSKQSVTISSFSLCLDTVLNIIFIFGFNMGVKGAALTTSITRSIEFIIILIYSKKMIVKPKIFNKISKILHKDFLHCSIPHLFNSIFWGIGTATYSSIIGHLGGAIVIAYSTSMLIRNLANSMCRGLTQGVEIILADNLGSGSIQKAKILGSKFSKFSILCGVVCGILVLIIGSIFSYFMNLDDDVRNILRYMIYISAFYVFTQCINMVIVCGIFASGGDTAFDAYSVALTMWLVIIPIALCAGFWWKVPSIIVYIILSLDEIIKIPWIYIHYKKYKWLKNITREELK